MQVPYISGLLPYVSVQLPYISGLLQYISVQLPYISRLLQYVSVQLPYLSGLLPYVSLCPNSKLNLMLIILYRPLLRIVLDGWYVSHGQSVGFLALTACTKQLWLAERCHMVFLFEYNHVCKMSGILIVPISISLVIYNILKFILKCLYFFELCTKKC